MVTRHRPQGISGTWEPTPKLGACVSQDQRVCPCTSVCYLVHPAIVGGVRWKVVKSPQPTGFMSTLQRGRPRCGVVSDLLGLDIQHCTVGKSTLVGIEVMVWMKRVWEGFLPVTRGESMCLMYKRLVKPRTWGKEKPQVRIGGQQSFWLQKLVSKQRYLGARTGHFPRLVPDINPLSSWPYTMMLQLVNSWQFWAIPNKGSMVGPVSDLASTQTLVAPSKHRQCALSTVYKECLSTTRVLRADDI